MIDLRDNGMRNVNKYQTMWDQANDTTAIYAETNKDYIGTLQRRFSVLRLYSRFVART